MRERRVVGSPLGAGDSLSLRGIFSQDSGINFGSLSYVLPVGSDKKLSFLPTRMVLMLNLSLQCSTRRLTSA